MNRQAHALTTARDRFRNSIWPSGLPRSSPETVNLDWDGDDREWASSVDRAIFQLGRGFTQQVRLFHSPTATGRDVLILHMGHDGGSVYVDHHYDTAQYFADHGISVCMVCMVNNPSLNGSESITTPNNGTQTFTAGHTEFDTYLYSQGVEVLPYFLDHAFRLVPWLKSRGYQRVHMTGLSGGGWTTIWAGALDPTLGMIFPVSANIPRHLAIMSSINSGDLGDFEQYVPRWYQSIRNEELYPLGAIGRRAIYFMFRHDSVAFSLLNRETQTQAIYTWGQQRIGTDGYLELVVDASGDSDHAWRAGVRTRIAAEVLA